MRWHKSWAGNKIANTLHETKLFGKFWDFIGGVDSTLAMLLYTDDYNHNKCQMLYNLQAQITHAPYAPKVEMVPITTSTLKRSFAHLRCTTFIYNGNMWAECSILVCVVHINVVTNSTKRGTALDPWPIIHWHECTLSRPISHFLTFV